MLHCHHAIMSCIDTNITYDSMNLHITYSYNRGCYLNKMKQLPLFKQDQMQESDYDLYKCWSDLRIEKPILKINEMPFFA